MKYRILLVVFLFVTGLVTGYYNLPLVAVPFLLFWSRPKYIKETQQGKVRLLTYNLFMRPSIPFMTHTESDYKNERLEIFLRNHAERFDVMMLQELFSMFTFRQSKLLNDTYEHAVVGPAAQWLCWNVNGRLNVPLLDAGVVTVSKFPITRMDRWVYTQGNKIDGWLPKCCIWTLIHLHNERYLNVFNTHMQSSHSHWASSFTSDRIRQTQVDEMIAFVKQKMTIYRYPALLCGDFNLDSRNFPLDYAMMMEKMSQHLGDLEAGRIIRDLTPDHPITFGCPGETVFTMPTDVDSKMRLDYMIYVGHTDWCQSIKATVEEFKCAEQPFTQLSDHYGLSCVIEF